MRKTEKRGIAATAVATLLQSGVWIAVSLALGAGQPALAQRAVTTQQTLLDRIQIEDLMTSYYYHLGHGNPEVYEKYYADGFVFDVNGKIFHGLEGLKNAYHVEKPSKSSPAPRSTYHMLMNNPLIEVRGDTATARFIWTGFVSDSVKAPPRPVQQGREYDVLVKQNGDWRIKKRTIISDAGLEDEFDGIYKPRMDYDPLKDQ